MNTTKILFFVMGLVTVFLLSILPGLGVSFIFFILVSFLLFCIPGIIVLGSFSKISQYSWLSLSWVVGVSIFLLINYVCAYFHVPWLAIIFYGLFYVYIVLKKKYKTFTHVFALRDIDGISLGVILIGTLVLVSSSFFSGWQTSNGMQFIGYVNRADGLIHVAYIKHLASQFPPQHIGLSGVPLKGYHYFYDFLLSRLVYFFHFNVFDLYYRFFPLFLLTLYGTSLYTFVSLVKERILTQRFVLLFAYFSYSFAPVLSLLGSMDPQYGFGLTQIMEFIFNPSILLGISMLLVSGYLLLTLKNSYKAVLVVGVILGLTSEVKIYAGVAGICMLGGYILYRFLYKKTTLPYVCAACITFVLTILTFIPNNAGSVGLLWHPGFLYEQLMQSGLFDKTQWITHLRVYEAHSNYPRIILLYVEGFLLFWILSLGLRIFAIFGLVTLISRKNRLTAMHVILVMLVVPPILIGSFFVQSLSIFDTNQFFWVPESILAIPVGFVFAKIAKKTQLFGTILLIILIILFVWNAYYQILLTNVIRPFSPYIISTTQEKFFKTVSQQVPAHESIVYVPHTSSEGLVFYEGPVIAAFTGRATYFEIESVTQQLFVKTINVRKVQIEQLQKAMITCNTKEITVLLKNVMHTRNVITVEPILCKQLSLVRKASGENMYFYQRQ